MCNVYSVRISYDMENIIPRNTICLGIYSDLDGAKEAVLNAEINGGLLKEIPIDKHRELFKQDKLPLRNVWLLSITSPSISDFGGIVFILRERLNPAELAITIF